jgi:hypothetical protein
MITAYVWPTLCIRTLRHRSSARSLCDSLENDVVLGGQPLADGVSRGRYQELGQVILLDLHVFSLCHNPLLAKVFIKTLVSTVSYLQDIDLTMHW